MSESDSPRSRRRIASLRWCGVSLKGRPKLCPRALARSRPSPVRARINSRSNSASPPCTVSIKRPCAVAGVGPCVGEGSKPGFLACDRREGVEKVAGRACQPVEPRHRHHVAGADLGQQPAKLRPVRLGSARHFAIHFLHPVLVSWRTWASMLWPSVDTPPQPHFTPDLLR
jgi:hypothetical protein